MACVHPGSHQGPPPQAQEGLPALERQQARRVLGVGPWSWGGAGPVPACPAGLSSWALQLRGDTSGVLYPSSSSRGPVPTPWHQRAQPGFLPWHRTAATPSADHMPPQDHIPFPLGPPSPSQMEIAHVGAGLFCRWLVSSRPPVCLGQAGSSCAVGGASRGVVGRGQTENRPCKKSALSGVSWGCPETWAGPLWGQDGRGHQEG